MFHKKNKTIKLGKDGGGRCPKGQRKNPKTGECEEISDKIKEQNLKQKEAYKIGVEKKKTAKIIVNNEPVKAELTRESEPMPIEETAQEPLVEIDKEPTPIPIETPAPEPVPEIVEEPIEPTRENSPPKSIQEIIREPTPEPTPEPVTIVNPLETVADTVPPREGRRKCPNGYRYNPKTNLCHKLPNKKTEKVKSSPDNKSKTEKLLQTSKIEKEKPKPETIKEEIIEENREVNIPTIVNEYEKEKQLDDEEIIDKVDINIEKELKNLDPLNNQEINRKELFEYTNEKSSPDTTYDFLYPTLNDPNFTTKITKKREFFNTQYDGAVYDVKKQAEILCGAEFELLPHQLFVKNFLSFQTPYNSLLLYHALGTGKTCSSIGIAEEMRAYMKQIGLKQKIIVVASPNVQANFRMQLFDERKLRKISQSDITGEMENTADDLWALDTCVGNSLLKEINPTNIKGIPKEKITNQINKIINTYYQFMGYGQLANYIMDVIQVSKDSNYTEKERQNMEIRKIKQNFNNRLIIIDEIHNIRLTDENKNKKVAVLLMKLAKYAEGLRFVFLSATPMYNSYKEIIWLTNLLNLNDKRSIIDISDVFTKDGEFVSEKIMPDGTIKEDGKSLLQRKLTGYISYVRGENPYSFPFRIYPDQFAPENTIKSIKYPSMQMNSKPIEEPIKYLNLYLNKMGDYQSKSYSAIIQNMRNKSYNTYNAYGEMREMPTFENMEAFGYTLLQDPLMLLNIVYPSSDLDLIIEKQNFQTVNENEINQISQTLSGSIGTTGLKTSIKWEETNKPLPNRFNFEYTPSTMKKYGPIFKPENIHKYSSKIANICNCVRNSKGIVLIYSQYIDGGVIPIALALEEMGFSRYSSNPQYNRPLFKNNKQETVDAFSFKTRSECVASGEDFNPARYIMITGDKSISPANTNDIKYVTDSENKYGKNVKVVIISKAGSEGLDFKNIRQVHILEPWYNMNRIEQIIGRGVRNLSHCGLPFEERNVEIYLHSTVLESGEEETADLYLYRLAEKKAVQIGKITRLLKENSVDCLLNIGQTNFSIENFTKLVENQNIKINLSSGKTIDFQFGDRPFTDLCDYMDNCLYKCNTSSQEITREDTNSDTYNIDFVKINNDRISSKIRDLYKEQPFYKRDSLINAINIVKQYPIDQIYYALTQFVNNKNEYLVDKYGRMGRLINREDYYVFQPIEITDENASIFERTSPIEYKRESYELELPKEISKERAKQQLNQQVEGVKQPQKQEKKEPEQIIQKENREDEEIIEEEIGENPPEKVIEEKGKKPKKEPKAKPAQPPAPLQETANTYDGLMDKFKENFEIVFSEKKIKIGSGEKNRYKHANHVIEHIEMVYEIPREKIEKYIVDHMLDMLLLPDKMKILNELYISSPDKTETDPTKQRILEIVKEYFEYRKMENAEKTAFILNKQNGWKIFIKPEEDEEIMDGIWNEGEPEDYRLFERELDKYTIDDEKINIIVGFVNLFKDKEMFFKVKDVRQARNNSGARCGDSTGKADVIKLINTLFTTPMYDDSTEILHFGLCVILEILMRHFNETQRDGKVYFLTPEETAVNDIVHFSLKI